MAPAGRGHGNPPRHPATDGQGAATPGAAWGLGLAAAAAPGARRQPDSDSEHRQPGSGAAVAAAVGRGRGPLYSAHLRPRTRVRSNRAEAGPNLYFVPARH